MELASTAVVTWVGHSVPSVLELGTFGPKLGMKTKAIPAAIVDIERFLDAQAEARAEMRRLLEDLLNIEETDETAELFAEVTRRRESA